MRLNLNYRLVSCLLAYVSPVKALEWWEKVEYLTYSPRYFGPNAFPIPELVGGSLSSRWEVELRGEYHKTRGDQTKDIFTRLYIPVVKGRVGVNVSWVFQEWYEMSPEVRDERYAVELKSPIVCRGDVIFNFYFQALRSEKWMDIGTYRGFSLDCNYAGFRGYRDNGDKPMILRTKLNYELKKNILSFQYKHGMKDHLYDSYSLAYIRCF